MSDYDIRGIDVPSFHFILIAQIVQYRNRCTVISFVSCSDCSKYWLSTDSSFSFFFSLLRIGCCNLSEPLHLSKISKVMSLSYKFEVVYLLRLRGSRLLHSTLMRLAYVKYSYTF